ncbi:MAG: transcriptional regulator/antitoxin, MazE [Planctomycetes bacterium]|jgi:antitoxin MazE|nr:transcriptional regulator/antitoxin, MazE [Planctomycetota bacterium]
MVVKVQKWGNSHALRISKRILEDANLSVGDPVDVVVREGVIVVTPASRVRGRHKLSRLVARIPRGLRVEEVDWGPPVGREVW